MWKNLDDSYEYIPANGASGGTAVSVKSPGTTNWNNLIGKNGDDALDNSRQTGGGSINIFANNIISEGNYNVNGGSTSSLNPSYGYGGNGSINIQNIKF